MIDFIVASGVFDYGLVQAALRALLLAFIVGAIFAALKERDPRVLLAGWRVVLVAAVLMPLLMSWMRIPLPTDMTAISHVAPSGGEVPTTGPFGMQASSPASPESTNVWDIAVYGYFAVASLLLLRLITGVVLALRLRAAATPVAESWTNGADVRSTPAIHAPVTVGSTILVPETYERWTDDVRRAVFLHEKEHVMRGDFYFQVLAILHRAVFWFSPLAWWLNAKLAELAEVASDRVAVESLQHPTDYADVLLNFANVPSQRGLAPMTVAMARPATVRRRIERVLQREERVMGRSRMWRLATVAVVAAIALPAVVSFVRVPAVLAQPHIVAPGEAAAGATIQRVALTRETRDVAAFEGVSLAGAGEVHITVGPKVSVVVEAETEVLKDVRTEVRDGLLIIDYEGRGRRNGPLTAHVTLPRLTAVLLGGSGRIQFSGVNGGETAVSLSGSGAITGTGKLDSLQLAISGSGEAEFEDLVTKDANVSISGSGDTVIQTLNNLNVQISGSGRVSYVGKPANIFTSVNGSGTVGQRS